MFFPYYVIISGQENQKLFQELYEKNDTLGQRKLLLAWETLNNQDPDLYVAYFNYYTNRSKQEYVELSSNTEGKTYEEVRRGLTSDDDPIGFIQGVSIFNPLLIRKGFYYAEKGIEIAPNRLDIRFGNIFIFFKMKDWKNYTREIIRTINFGASIDNQWIWKENKPLVDAKTFLFENIQIYQNQLYDTNDDKLLVYMREIAESVLKLYPDQVQSMSNLSITYMLNKEYDKALEFLLKAIKIKPNDYVIQGNIAHAYKMKNDKKNAILYYKLVQKYGDVDSSKYAQQQIDELSK